jgi:hypothetical protein
VLQQNYTQNCNRAKKLQQICNYRPLEPQSCNRATHRGATELKNCNRAATTVHFNPSVAVCATAPRGFDEHTSANVSIRQQTSSYVSVAVCATVPRGFDDTDPCCSTRQDTSGYVRIRQDTSAYVIIRHHTLAYVNIRQHTSAYVSIRQRQSREDLMTLIPAAQADVC